MKIINLRPPRIAMFLTFLALVLHLIPNIWTGLHFSVPMLGIALGVIGFILMMWSWWLFQKGKVDICPVSKTAILLTQGPYRISRNPMYLGMILMLLGLAFFLGTPPFYLSTLIFYLIINFIFCPFEENKLVNTFGDEYINYRIQIRRWI